MTSSIESAVENLETWLRHRFVILNSELEHHYRTPRYEAANDDTVRLQRALVKEGSSLIDAVAVAGGGEVAGRGFDRDFSLLGAVGFFMAACARHGVLEVGQPWFAGVSALATALGAALDTVPRTTTSHLQIYNRYRDRHPRRFTSLDAERVFNEGNTCAQLAYCRAAEALRVAVPLGPANPAMLAALRAAESALREAETYSVWLFDNLDPDDFFLSVRPYFKSHPVGQQVFRGANAGDFGAVTEIDLRLGLTSMADRPYARIVDEKRPYLTPADRSRVRDAEGDEALLDQFLAWTRGSEPTPIGRANAAAFVGVCRQYARVAAHHHDALLERFISAPAARHVSETENLTASGPPLDVLLAALQRLRDLRCAVERDDIPSKYRELAIVAAAGAASRRR